jgi:hypothetical protein
MARDAAFYRHLADQCREYISNAKNQFVKDQFELRLIEFEAQAAEATERELNGGAECTA